MAKPLDFNKIKKRYFTVTLADENNTTLMISTPTKEVMDEFISMKDYLEGNTGEDVIDALCELCAKIMSRNKGGIKVTKEALESMLDFDDIVIFIKAYTDFISELTNSKN